MGMTIMNELEPDLTQMTPDELVIYRMELAGWFESLDAPPSDEDADELERRMENLLAEENRRGLVRKKEITVRLLGNAFWRNGDMRVDETDADTDLHIVITETDEFGPSWAEVILTTRAHGEVQVQGGVMKPQEQDERVTHTLMLLPGSYDRREVREPRAGTTTNSLVVETASP